MIEPTVNSAGRINLGLSRPVIPLPDFIEAQKRSYEWFRKEGIQRIFSEVNPVKDTLGRMWTLEFMDYRFGKNNRTPKEAIKKSLSYNAPLYATVRLTSEKTGEIKEEEIFIADIPVMTDLGYFVFNGITKVVIHQIVRSEGILFEENKQSTPLKRLYSARLMPMRGNWFEFEVSKNNIITVRLINKRPKILITTLFRALGFSSDEDIKKAFGDVMGFENDLIEATLERDPTSNRDQAIIHIYSKIRPDESVTLESAEKYIKGFFFNNRRFDLGRVGRYQLNKKLGVSYEMKPGNYRLFVDDLVRVIKALVEIHNDKRKADDVDHLANRRIRSIGEIAVDELRTGVRRMEKTIRDRMSMHGEDARIAPSALMSTKPVAAAVNSMFGTGQLCGFMDQDNILGEFEHKRKVTAGGPKGLTKERATFSVRDVHFSHYSRFCPVTTPEGASIGVVLNLSLHAKINEFGFIEAPYVKVLQKVKNNPKDLLNRIPVENIKDPKTGTTVARIDVRIDKKSAEKISKIKEIKEIEVKSYRTDEVIYVPPVDENKYVVTMSTVDMDEFGNLTGKLLSVRADGHFYMKPAQEVQLMDVVPSQIGGLSFSTIPYVPCDDPARALMGSNMQKQAVPLVKNESPIVGTGYGEVIARQSGWAIYAEADGEILYVDAKRIEIKYKGVSKPVSHEIITFMATNQDTCFSQSPVVSIGQKVKKGELLVDGPSMENGELALGTNLTTACMIIDGYVYEDGFLISERLVKEDILTSIHIKKYEQNIQETELGSEILTNDIPNVSERTLRNLDEDGIVRVGARVQSQDVLVGTIAPRGEKELTSEERLLRAIFGEQAREVRDNSLRVPHGQGGVVVGTRVLSSEDGDKLQAGVIKQIKVWVAQTRKIDLGDKMAGRHGDKGTVSGILPVEDMPFLEDGTPIDIVISPILVKRMNIGQLLEMKFAKLAKDLGIKIAVPNFEKLNVQWLYDECEKEGVSTDERVDLYDGRTGTKFPKKVKVGPKYMNKLKHIASLKIHSRSTGPYTLVTQQPLGGKAQMGGQRFGEMEVWALEAHGVPSILQEMFTIKSDDVKGRADAYKAIIHGDEIETVTTPESFKVLIRELNALSLNMDLICNKAVEQDGEKKDKFEEK